MQDLLTVIAMWLVVDTGLPAADELPRVELVSADRMAEIRQDTRDVIASYRDLDRTIYLASDWTSSSPADVSVLVHELVHHLQNADGRTYACPEEREREAYEAQARWLALLDRELLSEFDLDPMTMLLRTRCLPP